MDFEEADEEELLVEYGEHYLKWCKKINEVLPKDPEKIEEKQREDEKKLKNIETELRSLKNDLNKKKIKHGSDSKKYRKKKKKFEKKRKKLEKKKDKLKQQDFQDAVRFLGWDLKVHQVLTFAGFISIIGLISVGITFLVLSLLGIGLSSLLMFAPALILVPVGLFVFTANYPEFLAKRVRVKSIGRSPTCINYMIMSMSLNPALDQAVKFTSKHTDEPLSTGFRRMIWDVMMRKYSTIEDSLVDFALKWGEWNEDLRQALYVIRSATLETSSARVKEDLDKAYDVILSGTKSTMEDFASSLSGPTMVLFALGVILPLVIGAMLPMLSIQLPGTAGMGAMEEAGTTGAEESPMVSTPLIVLLMNFGFPSAAGIYSYYILGKRPGTSKPPQVDNPVSPTKRKILLIVSIVGGIFISLFAFEPLSKYFILAPGSFLPVLWGVTFAVSVYLLGTTIKQKMRKDEISQMEDEFPNALFQLGNRIAEGKPVEKALEDIEEGIKGTEILDLFEDIRYRLKVTSLSLEDALFDEELGALTGHPSRTIKGTMRTVVKATKKDNLTAGRVITDVSTYLRDLKKIENDIKASLQSAVSMMRSTALFFAPIVMGVTTGLYNLLYDQFQAMPNPAPMIPPSNFSMVIGIYLFLMTLVIIYFSIGILEGEDRVEMKFSIGVGLPVAMGIYTLTSIFSQTMIGV